ncbi:hypothetical protein K2173_022164 [Erythroxylum novogranatense]|uniref:ARM repeat superfamily protein n=1 Tax=Erythroxylum novogranatense TaxID=1862640 RepID=A0AAV8SU69_9ROSI|nr:hypothetical protein K2173_022164 [Erythroxylum novogranatense]
MFNFEGFIPKLCQFAQEEGENERSRSLCSAGLQALSSMVWFMGQHSHISVEFDNVVSVVLENYGGKDKNLDNLGTEKQGSQCRWVQEVLKTKGHMPPSADAFSKVPSWETIFNEKGEINVTAEDAQNPCFWSRVCLNNMAKLGKEVSTVRRVLESLFLYFDNGNLWSLDHGLAFPVLKDMQFLMDNSGQNMHLLLSILIKHLDHKNVLKQPQMQLDVVEVTASLAQLAKTEPSVAIIGAVSDVMRHLRKSMHCSLDDKNLGSDAKEWNKNFRESVDKFLVELCIKVGDACSVLDVMAVMLENISNVTVIARTTISAVYRTAQIIASIPNLSYLNKTFPEALFHHLLPAMVHPDHETRIGAHRIFSIVLVPSSVFPRPSSISPHSKKGADHLRTLSRTVSVFSSSAALFEKLTKDKSSTGENAYQENKENIVLDNGKNSNGMLNKLKSSYSRVYSSNNPMLSSTTDEKSTSNTNKESEVGSLRLSSRQISVLLSSIWAQSISPANLPQNYEAIAHTFSLVLLFSRGKNSSHEALTQSFQLAFSLRNMALNKGGPLPPARRRSLFTLATSMILFSSKAFNIVSLVYCAKDMLTEKAVDPFLQLVEDCKLQAVDTSGFSTEAYGSKADDNDALKSLSQIDISGDQSNEFLAAEILKSLDNLTDSKASNLRDQLLAEFSPDDGCGFEAQLLTDKPIKRNKVNWKDESHTAGAMGFAIDETFQDSSESQTNPQMELVSQSSDLLSVNQLIESVIDTVQVGRMSVTAPNVPYKEMALQCETLRVGKQQKMSHVMSSQMKQESLVNFSLQNHSDEVQKVGNPSLDQKSDGNSQRPPAVSVPRQCATEFQHHPNFLRLPASSPYDHFLKAAGC